VEAAAAPAKPQTVSAKPAAFPLGLPKFLWSGSWEGTGNVTDRFEFTANLFRTDISLRFQLLDQRPASSWDAFAASFADGGSAVLNPGAGIYHAPTGSRLLYGTLDSHGLAARIRNIWTRGAPYVEAHENSSADLKTTPSSTAVSQVYAYLGTPPLSLGPGKFRGFTALAFDGESPAASAGTDYAFANGGSITVEGFYAAGTMEERRASTWFSEKPSLPERDTRLAAGTLIFTLPGFGFAADLARSETFSYGRDYYAGLGLRFGDRPWRLSMALDGAGSRFVDSGTQETEAGLRFAARLERQNKRSGLFRLGLLFRGPGPEEGLWQSLTSGDLGASATSFTRSSLDFYYRPPASSAPLALERVSLSLDRDGREPEKTLDSADVLAALKLWSLKTVSAAKVSGIVQHGAYRYNSFTVSQNFSWTFYGHGPQVAGNSTNSSSAKRKHLFTLRVSARGSYKNTAGDNDLWTMSFSLSGQSKKSRLGFTISTPEYPRKWKYTLSWRMQF
jgi:hypothetical protein